MGGVSGGNNCREPRLLLLLELGYTPLSGRPEADCGSGGTGGASLSASNSGKLERLATG